MPDPTTGVSRGVGITTPLPGVRSRYVSGHPLATNRGTAVTRTQHTDQPGRPGPFAWTARQAEVRAAAGLRRRLSPRPADSPLLDLAGNDYLGLTRHPEVTRAGADACLRWGAGSTGSRLVTGSTALHAELEAEIAAFTGFEAALVFASGYAANVAAATALSG